MGEVVLKIENLSKQYRLGLVGTGTISHDLNTGGGIKLEVKKILI